MKVDPVRGLMNKIYVPAGEGDLMLPLVNDAFWPDYRASRSSETERLGLRCIKLTSNENPRPFAQGRMQSQIF